MYTEKEKEFIRSFENHLNDLVKASVQYERIVISLMRERGEYYKDIDLIRLGFDAFNEIVTTYVDTIKTQQNIDDDIDNILNKK